jgi:hypothetical protein
MNWETIALGIVLFDFLVLTGYALTQVGYIGLLEYQFADWGGIQVILNFVIVCTLAIIWMVIDARKRGANPWPFLVITLFAGTIGPLLYLLRREWGSHPKRDTQMLKA